MKASRTPKLPTVLLIATVLTLPIVWHAAPDPKTAHNRADFYWWWIIPLVVVNWIISDARHHRRQLCYDHDTFQFWAWPLLGPIYLARTRGWRAIWPLLLFGLIWIIAVLEAIILTLLFPR